MARSFLSISETDVPELRANKRQKIMVGNLAATQIEDDYLTLIPHEVLTATKTSEDKDDGNGDGDGDGSSSLKYLPLPSKLAYPFWYDPHPIAKWAADRLKSKLPSYNNSNDDTKTKTGENESDQPEITLGKMYGVLVVSIDNANGTDGNADTQLPKKLGYLQAYSGTMPRPQYGGSSLSTAAEQISNTTRFVPPVYDRFAKTKTSSGEDDDDDDVDFDYEKEEEILNGMTREIERLESCPQRKEEEERLKEAEAKLQKDLSDAKRVQKQNKVKRRARRKELRQQILANDNESDYNFTNEKEAHNCFMEYNEEYQQLEEQLVQESAFDQREFRTVKAGIDAELETVQNSLKENLSRVENLKQQRKDGSNGLQKKLFDHYKLLNVTGATKTPVEIFKKTPLKVPPSGSGDCSAIKLFQHAFSKGYRPLALAEFWWGPSPSASDGEVPRTHGNYYPCCRGKCEPILTRHMLLGTDVASDPLTEQLNKSKESEARSKKKGKRLSIVYEDEWLVVVNKPHDMLSVPGRQVKVSIKTDLQKRYPNATGPLLVHRLDYSTSGLLLAAKDSNTHKALQAQFIDRSVEKRYEALLEGKVRDNPSSNNNDGTSSAPKKGKIDLPLAGDYLHRPMQKVERGPQGKSAVTFYEVVEKKSTNQPDANAERTRVYFYPKTGRTHQLRVHASHPEGLGIAIVGDDIYGQRDKRLCLHAGFLKFYHPHTKERVTFEMPAPF